MDQIFLWWIFCAIIGGAIGAIKGKTGAGVLWGGLLGPIGILVISVQTSEKKKSLRGTKMCPKCAERVQREAVLCKHCGSDVETKECPKCKNLIHKVSCGGASKVPCPKCFTMVRLVTLQSPQMKRGR